eukprot:SAG31_NODE_3271_length_4477_cov_2.348561_6_plen_30_part_00
MEGSGRIYEFYYDDIICDDPERSAYVRTV